jgi:filamentous hemagglutinin
VLGGLSSVANHDRFGAGFLAGTVTTVAAPYVSTSAGAYVEGTVIESIIGGTASVLGAGRFANGAVTGAFGYLFNSLMHPSNTLEAGIQSAIMKGDTAELRVLLDAGGLSSNDLAIAQRALSVMEDLSSADSSMLADRYGVDFGNKLSHVFENNLHDHGLDSLVKEFGSNARAFVEIQRSVEGLDLGPGQFVRSINIGEYSTSVTVRGYVQDGIVRINTIYR